MRYKIVTLVSHNGETIKESYYINDDIVGVVTGNDHIPNNIFFPDPYKMKDNVRVIRSIVYETKKIPRLEQQITEFNRDIEYCTCENTSYHKYYTDQDITYRVCNRCQTFEYMYKDEWIPFDYASDNSVFDRLREIEKN